LQNFLIAPRSFLSFRNLGHVGCMWTSPRTLDQTSTWCVRSKRISTELTQTWMGMWAGRVNNSSRLAVWRLFAELQTERSACKVHDWPANFRGL